MPIISIFYGITITIHFNDHNPPHFHAKYGEFEALIDIQTGCIMKGRLPPKATSLTQEWRAKNEKSLYRCWLSIRNKGRYFKIKGLE